MTKIFTLIFAALTVIVAGMTYYDIGLTEKQLTGSEISVRSGSYGGHFSTGGGFRTGK